MGFNARQYGFAETTSSRLKKNHPNSIAAADAYLEAGDRGDCAQRVRRRPAMTANPRPS